MDHAGDGMAALTAPGELALVVAVEHGSPSEQRPNGGRPFRDERPHGVEIGQSAAGPDRVGLVELDRIALAGQGRRDTPLGPGRRRLVEAALRDEPDASGPPLGELEGRRAPGDTAADDEGVERLPGRAAVHRTTRRWSMSRTAPTRAAMSSATSPATLDKGSRRPSATTLA